MKHLLYRLRISEKCKDHTLSVLKNTAIIGDANGGTVFTVKCVCCN